MVTAIQVILMIQEMQFLNAIRIGVVSRVRIR
ncbi:hypothetical protein X743_34040 [Mesorhizobium sp. LNHC252B00]|nr:hypothetical protein X743_34040 [Mesorhizobium sp. LNHC252B00]